MDDDKGGNGIESETQWDRKRLAELGDGCSGRGNQEMWGVDRELQVDGGEEELRRKRRRVHVD